METVQESIKLVHETVAQSLGGDYDTINKEAEAIRKELLTIWKYEWVLPRSAHLRDTLTAHIFASEWEVFKSLSSGSIAKEVAAELVRQDHELVGQLKNMDLALRIHDGYQFRLALQDLIASLSIHESLEKEKVFPTLGDSSPGPFNWDDQRWVYIETVDGAAYTGYVSEQDSEYVYLHFTRIRDRTGAWLDYWTWTERNGKLPSVDALWGCAGVMKRMARIVTKIEETYPGDVGRCWVCGRRISEGHLCSSECEDAYNSFPYKES